MRKAPMAGVPMDGLPPKSKQNDATTGVEIEATVCLAEADTDFAEKESAENDRRLFPRHSWRSRRYAPPAFNARHACPLRFSAAAVVLLLNIERFTRDIHARVLRYVPPEELSVVVR